MPVTANFHQNWIKMIQQTAVQWGEVILISYSLSEEFLTGLRISVKMQTQRNVLRENKRTCVESVQSQLRTLTTLTLVVTMERS